MTKAEMRARYFDWMFLAVSNHRPRRYPYKKLLSFLYDTDFTYTIAMDENRFADGIDLRYRFAQQYNYPDPMVSSLLDDRPCSILEMMVALAIRCEEHIMEDADIGDRTGNWFWGMIESLGLKSMTDDRYDEYYVEETIRIFLNRQYAPNGEGGLFTIRNCRQDIRNIEIWYQMSLYLNSLF